MCGMYVHVFTLPCGIFLFVYHTLLGIVAGYYNLLISQFEMQIGSGFVMIPNDIPYLVSQWFFLMLLL